VSEGPSIDDYSAEFWRRAKVASNVLHLARLVRPQDEQVGALYRYCLFELDGAECGVAHYAVLIEPGEIIWTGETAASCASSTSCRLRRTIRRSSASCASSRRRRPDPPPGAVSSAGGNGPPCPHTGQVLEPVDVGYDEAVAGLRRTAADHVLKLGLGLYAERIAQRPEELQRQDDDVRSRLAAAGWSGG
jgi:hypothetical protein